jgi:glycosyltransferase involved in cell wall biosynthesis
MNVLIIPSWYPWRGAPLRGLFFMEQAVCLGKMRPDWKIAVAVWGQRRYTFSLHDPFKSAAVLADFLQTKFRPRQHFLLPNVCEYRQPVLEWTKKWRQGNIAGMERACRKILQRASRDLGGIDLIHAHVAFPGGWIAMRLGQRFRLPFVITEHMGDFPFVEFRNSDGTIQEAISAPMRGARAVVAVSPSQAGRIAACGLPRPIVIPNMIDEEFFKPGAGKKNAGDSFIFFALSAFKPDKGLGDLLQAVALCRQQGCSKGMDAIRLRIGGGGEMERELQALARRLQIEPWVHWLGRLDRRQALQEYQSCDCFVQPSHRESFSIVVLEALACGKPVIATRSGGPESLVTPGNGILVPVQDPAELARAMAEMTRCAGRFDSLAIRRAVLETFSREKVCDRIEAVYRSAMEREPR